jgi:hypothetical protein
MDRWSHWHLMLYGDAVGTSRWDLVKWWEARRIRYNLILFLIGMMSIFLVVVAGSYAVKPGVDFEEPLGFILIPPIYGILANICYSFGPLVDWIKNNGQPSRRLFKAGLYFSMLLTALPGLWALFCAARALITGQKLD